MSDLLVRLQTLRNRAERRERRDLNIIRSRASTNTDDSEEDEDEVFENDDEQPPPLLHPCDDTQPPTEASHPTQVEPEPEKISSNPNTRPGKSHISKSLDEIINVVQKSQMGDLSNLNNIEVRFQTLENSIKTISNLCSNISMKLNLVIDNSSTNSTRLSALEHRVDELDRNTKTYVDTKIKNVVIQASNLSKENNIPSEPLNGPMEALKKEIKSLKRKQQSDERAISLISETIANVKDQVDSTIDDSRSFHNDSTQFSRSRINRDNERSLMHDSIESSAKLIRQLIAVNVSMHSELTSIKKSNDDIKKVTAYIKTCQDSLMKYVTFDNFDNNFVSSVKSLLDQANNWILQVEIIYSSSEAHAVSNSKGDISNIGVFTDNAEKTVYEFLEEIEIGLLGWGTSRQRAAQIYNRHLSEDIKSRTLDCSDNFSDIKKWLIKEFGSPSRIIGDIIADLRTKSKPPLDDIRARYTFYSHLGKAIARLDKLIRVPTIDINDLESALYSRSTLNDLLNILPTNDLNQLRRQMVKKKLDWKNPSGIMYFAVFKDFVDTEWDLLGPYKDIGQVSKSRSTHFAEPAQQSSFNVNVPPPPLTVNKQPWYSPGLKFPCPINHHNHEMAVCKEFLTMHPRDRWEQIEKYKICLTCLRPRDVCTTRPCSHISSVPEILICQLCSATTQYKKVKLTPLNILMCRKKPHAESRAPPEMIHQQFSKYFGCTSNNQIPQDIHIQLISVNFMHQAYSLTPVDQLSQQKLELIKTPPPVIHSQTGEIITGSDIKIIPEITEHAMYLMQILKIGKSEVLTFFDSGANVNLIEGDLAIRENLQCISDKPSSLSVVGGNQIKTEYGQYTFSLGPTSENEFHTLTCLGMDSVTNEFSKYDLADIIQEFRSKSNNSDKHVSLPPYAAGSSVKLLIGIKNNKLDPTLIEVLPSGIGVYRSPFVDVFGSDIIFAGPHATFTRGNQSMDSHISQAIFKIRTLSQENIYPKINIPVKIVAHKTEGIYFYPTPLSDTDLIEAGGSVQYEEDPQSKIEKFILDRKSPGRDWNTCSAHAARIPISKIRELVDQDDVEQLVTYRCEQCAKCEECRRTPRVTAVSLQEAREQKIIEDSVKFDFINKRVEVILPFLKNPNTFLTEKHQGSSNMRQARRIYMTQCKKSTEDKAGTRLTHADLIKRGFMVKLLDMPTDCQKLVREAPFNHYYPWFIVSKEDSISTPRRIVVDPSCTGLNQILPKGENRIGTIPDIIIRNRTKPIGWASDISKMYNQLRLDKSAYPFSLFLFHESLSSEIEPDTYVMVRAWYGVVQTGQQAGYALDHLAEIGRVDFPLAPECIARDRYVDDILPGADSIQEVDEQISQVKQLLSRAGFSLKYVIKTGDIPDESASSDGETIKMLGYKWHTLQDTLHPGISELNVNKKIRGTQKPNPTPIVTEDDAESILKSASLSRRIIISKIAEFFDPVGLWEPMKLQLKLHSARLNSLPWDQKLSSEEENFWKTRLIQFVRFRDLSAPRCTIPPDSESSSGIRLICMSDAGASAGGAAVYAGRKLHDGTWTCSLLTSRSRLMKATVPRNELSAILMMAELAFVAKKSLGSRVSRIIYLTDSNIAMSWMQNTNIKLRAYTFARVEASRRLIQMTTGEEEIPIFHIDGPKNIADLLTKYHELSIQDLSTGSLWQC